MYSYFSLNRCRCSALEFTALAVLMVLAYFHLFPIGFTTPTHGDIFGYPVFYDRTPYYIVPLTVRPILGLFLKIGGELPFNGMMAFFSTIGILSYAAPLIAFGKIFKISIPISVWILYISLVFSYPAHYLGLVHDLGTRLAFIFSMITIVFYFRYSKIYKSF